MSDVPGRVETLMGAILAHGAHPDAVRHLNAPDLQRREELGDRIARRLRLDRAAGHRILLGGEEWNILGGLVQNWLGAFALLF